MKLQLIDAHTHAHFAAYEKDWREVIDRALKAGVGMILVGTQYDTSARGIEVAKMYDGVYATVGLHPIHTEKSYHDPKELGGGEAAKSFTSKGEAFDYDAYVELAVQEKVVGIGECGLDFYRGKKEEVRSKQEKAFRSQIELALQVDKPLMVHCRDAFPELIEILKSYFLRPTSLQNPGVIHFFTGTPDDAKNLLQLGFSFTFGGAITYPSKVRLPADSASVATSAKGTALAKAGLPSEALAKGGDYDEAISIIPLDRILCETDAPYVAPLPYRGKRNEPSYIVETVKKLAELKGISFEEMAAHTFENTKRIFGI